MNQKNVKAPSPQSKSAVTQGGHLIAIVGGKGGVGKSVFAANLAAAIAADKKKGVLLLDADPASTGDHNLILGIKKINGTGDELLKGNIRNELQLKKLMTSLAISGSREPLYSLQMLREMEDLPDIDGDSFEYALKLMQRSLPYVVVDCGSHPEKSVLKILDRASLILVLTNPEILVLNQTRKVIEKLQTNLYPPEITKIILNKYTKGNPYNAQFLEQSLKRQVLGVFPEDNNIARAALNKSVPIALAASGSELGKSFYGLGRLLIDNRILDRCRQVGRKPKAAPKAQSNESGDDEVLDSMSGVKLTNPRNIFKLKVHQMLVEKMDLKKEQLNRNLTENEKKSLREKTKKIVVDILNAEDHQWKTRDESSKLVKEILDEALGLGPLEDLLDDPDVTEVMVNRADQIYLEKGGKNVLSKVTFTSNTQVMACIERIVNPLGRRIDEKSPYVDARLADGSRVHAIIPPLAIDGPMITIRKFPSKRLNYKDLVKFGSMTPEMADFLRSCIEAHLNVVISGGTGSGKTTLLNVLSGFIPNSERILTVEDAAELSLTQDHVGRLETRPANIEGTGAVTIRDLVKQTLRMKPDRVIVGEVRGGEALDMLQAMNTGHDGSMATVHANTPRDAVTRLETLVMMAGMDLPGKAIREQISSAVHLIVQASRLSDGSRKVTHITEVIGMQGDVVTTQDIFLFKASGLDKQRKIIGKHVATGFIPKFIEKLEASGVKVPRGLFKAA